MTDNTCKKHNKPIVVPFVDTINAVKFLKFEMEPAPLELSIKDMCCECIAEFNSSKDYPPNPMFYEKVLMKKTDMEIGYYHDGGVEYATDLITECGFQFGMTDSNKLRSRGFTEEQIKIVLTAVSTTCRKCGDAYNSCCCWNDE